MLAVAREFGGLDILVNNAGLGDFAPIEETALADYMPRFRAAGRIAAASARNRCPPAWTRRCTARR